MRLQAPPSTLLPGNQCFAGRRMTGEQSMGQQGCRLPCPATHGAQCGRSTVFWGSLVDNLTVARRAQPLGAGVRGGTDAQCDVSRQQWVEKRGYSRFLRHRVLHLCFLLK